MGSSPAAGRTLRTTASPLQTVRATVARPKRTMNDERVVRRKLGGHRDGRKGSPHSDKRIAVFDPGGLPESNRSAIAFRRTAYCSTRTRP